MKSVPQTLA